MGHKPLVGCTSCAYWKHGVNYYEGSCHASGKTIGTKYNDLCKAYIYGFGKTSLHRKFFSKLNNENM